MLEINSLIFSFSKVNSFSEIIFSKTSSFFSKLSFWEKSWTLCEAVSFSSGWNLGKIKTLKNEKITPGYHTVQWDGTNDNGMQVSTGMYFYTLQTEAKSAMRKMLFLK